MARIQFNRSGEGSPKRRQAGLRPQTLIQCCAEHMRVHNSEISEMFGEVADLLEIEGVNQAASVVARELEKVSDFTGRVIQGEWTVC